MIIEESKDRYIRVLEYKYMKVCMQMEVRLAASTLGGVDDPLEDLGRRPHRHGNVREGQQRGHRGRRADVSISPIPTK
jgi:hypothetical protein